MLLFYTDLNPIKPAESINTQLQRPEPVFLNPKTVTDKTTKKATAKSQLKESNLNCPSIMVIASGVFEKTKISIPGLFSDNATITRSKKLSIIFSYFCCNYKENS
ncbi:MAG: hypothetical protein A2W93_07700 [Bacteroidetes bacterium GWF2_43_63]|nr:MAG: hypothetical protein A2W94_09555 [Bacteroidetes bacterium GWE2_42_42]OFY53053.1 MAG: hypothetical protein A2W93_07700 [Bacteroidetes bacterium GWF2_43_63]HBG69184.1 hypothetical protein [Bacteroidales bacterium]HCB62545.1 hypothetical protein [Bacteroidales bacterium]